MMEARPRRIQVYVSAYGGPENMCDHLGIRVKVRVRLNMGIGSRNVTASSKDTFDVDEHWVLTHDDDELIPFLGNRIYKSVYSRHSYLESTLKTKLKDVPAVSKWTLNFQLAEEMEHGLRDFFSNSHNHLKIGVV